MTDITKSDATKQIQNIKQISLQVKSATNLNPYVTPHGETRKKWLNPNPRYSQFSTNGGVIPPSWVFTDCSSRIFISQFPANKITEIDLEVCEKAKFRALFCVFSHFLNVFFSKS